MNKVEILSPAGSTKSLKAAINASCDAIYIGGSKFGARAYADNPEQDTLVEAIEYAHIHDKKLYLTVNTLLKNNELKDELYEYLYRYYNAGLDAVIVQDMGVVHFINEHFPGLPIHASTQMSLNMAQGANVLKDYGITRFVPGRELSLEELKEIRNNTDLEIEVFVHGSLCYSYSGQCLMSSVLSGRSGNRGRCAQPCRMPYSLVEEGHKQLSVDNEKYLLSPKDICTLDLIPDLIDAGVDSFKIEGRMKRPEYTALTTYIYKKYVDKYLDLGRKSYERYIFDNKKEFKKDKMNLLDIYNRGGFSEGYLKKRNGRKMITLDKPNHSGLQVGQVSKVTKGHIWINLSEDINKGDVLKIVGKDANINTYEYTSGIALQAGDIADTNYDRRVTLEQGDLVFRVRNNELIDNLTNKFIEGKKQIPIYGKVNVSPGKELTISLSKDNISISVSGYIVQEAKNQPMSEDKIRKQIDKTNDTNFVFNNLDIDIVGKPFIPVSQLNQLRRQAILKLEEALIARFRREEAKKTKMKLSNKKDSNTNNYSLPNNIKKKDNHEPNTELGIHALVNTKDQLYVVAKKPEVSAIYIDSDIADLDNIHEFITFAKSYGKKTYLYLPHIFRKTTYDYFKDNIDKGNSVLTSDSLDGFVIRNLEEYSFLKNYLNNNNKEIITDYNLYIMNEEAGKMWQELGVYKFTGPMELNKYELKELTGLYYDIIVYGRTPLMVTAGCLMKTVDGGDNNHLNKVRNNYCCGKEFNNLILIDRLKVKFPVVRNCRHCYNTIYNSYPLSLLDKKREVLELKPNNIRLDFTIETKEETEEVLVKFIQAYYYNMPNIKEFDEFTRVHFNRGIE